MYGADPKAYGQYRPSHASDKSLGSSNIGRTLPRQISTGLMRGTQNVGIGGAQIDSSNNRIVLSASDGSSVGIGTIPGDTTGEVGLFALDTDGSLLWKSVNGTLYFYDKDSGVNYMTIGVLPDNTTGWAVAAPGENVADGITA